MLQPYLGFIKALGWFCGRGVLAGGPCYATIIAFTFLCCCVYCVLAGARGLDAGSRLLLRARSLLSVACVPSFIFFFHERQRRQHICWWLGCIFPSSRYLVTFLAWKCGIEEVGCVVTSLVVCFEEVLIYIRGWRWRAQASRNEGIACVY